MGGVGNGAWVARGKGKMFFAPTVLCTDNHCAQIKMKSTIVAGGAGVARGEGKMFFAPT